MAHRVVALLERIEIQKDFVITGGIAKNIGVVNRLQNEIGIETIKTDYDTQIAGALGAALFGKVLTEKARK
jgi:activator of 2-hydroxyglutaryl-CoA dehydratase